MSNFETKMSNPKLEILNSKQTQMSKTQEKHDLIKESTELMKIFGSIVEKLK
jgi:hypothetical protein